MATPDANRKNSPVNVAALVAACPELMSEPMK